MTRLIRFYCCLAITFSSLSVYGQTTEKPLTVVELYTSQGCYSCPPADTFLETLSEQENTITLSCHVTYWDYLGWKDTFSRQFCDNRQRSYQSLLKRGSRLGVYTPQMIINGRYGGVGSRQSFIKRLFSLDQQQQIPLQTITLSSSGQQLAIELPQLSTTGTQGHIRHKALTVWLLGTTGQHLLPIDSGENSGKRLPYTNPVEFVKNLGSWDGSSKTLKSLIEAVPTASRPVKDWVVLAQVAPLGEIVAAGRFSVSP